jgi:MFS transporter, DHA2 family, multidrug resistance protein
MAMAATAGAAPPVTASGLPPLPRFIGYMLMALGMFMAILDIQIVSASLREIQAGLSASADEIVWVQSAYLIAEVVMIPLSGFLGRALSTRWLFVISSAGFTLASVLCATATSIEQMVMYRALQGFLGGAMIPVTYATSFAIFGRARQVGVTVAVSMIVTLAPTVGPVLGGWITEYFSWQMLFLINVIPGLIITIGVAATMDIDKPNFALLRRIDVPGLLLMLAFLGSMEFVLEEGARKQWFEDPLIRNFTLLSIISAIGLFYRLATAAEPIVRLHAFANYNFAAGATMGAVLGVGLYGLTYVYPLYLSQVARLSSGQVGNIMSISGICMVLTAPLSGILARKIDPRLLVSIGFLTLGVSSWMTHGVTADWRFDQFLLPQILRGSGLMLCIVPMSALAFGTLPQPLLKDASGLFTLLRNLGGATGIAMINTILLWRTNFHWSRAVEHVNAARPEVQARLDELGAGMDIYGDGAAMATKQLSLLVQREVTVMAFGDSFFIMAVLFLVAAIVPQFLRKPASLGAAVDSH